MVFRIKTLVALALMTAVPAFGGGSRNLLRERDGTPTPTVEVAVFGSQPICRINNVGVAAASCWSISRAVAGTGHVGDYAQWQDGHWSIFSADTLRVTDRGVLVENTATNRFLQSRDFTNAAWTKTTMTTALNVTGIDNVANAASTLTATAGNATALQAVTNASTDRYVSYFIKRVTGTGTIQATHDNGSTWVTLDNTNCYDMNPVTPTLMAINTTVWVRCFTEQTVTNPTAGLRIVTNGDAIAVDMAQLEAAVSGSGFPSSPIPTTSALLNRNSDLWNLASTALTAMTNGGTTASATFEGIAPLVPSGSRGLGFILTTGTDRINVVCNTPAVSRLQTTTASVSVLNIQKTGPCSGYVNVAARIGDNTNSAVTIGGAAPTAGSPTGASPVWTGVGLGGEVTTAVNWDSYLSRARFWAGVGNKLTNAQLQIASRPGAINAK